jgi:hypothetical protein
MSMLRDRRGSEPVLAVGVDFVTAGQSNRLRLALDFMSCRFSPGILLVTPG